MTKNGKARPAYNRILLKLSGESLQGKQGFGIDGWGGGAGWATDVLAVEAFCREST